MAKATLHYPIATLHGNLGDSYYIRTMPSGKQVMQRRPDRSRHVPSPAELANQQRFKNTYALRDHSETTP